MLSTTVELFAGIGGFRLAADARQIRTVWANDHEERACEIYRRRFGADALEAADIRAVWEKAPRADLLTAGFPCQPFSSAGKKKGTRDPRGTLFQTIVDVLEKTRPEYFILENVKRLLSMEAGSHFATILNALSELSYDIEWRLVNVMSLGLPQNRQRVIIAGKLRETGPWLPRIHLATRRDLGTIGTRDYDRMVDPAFWREISEHDKRFPNWGLASRGRFYGANLTGFSDAIPNPVVRDILEESVSGGFDFTSETVKWLANNTPVDDFIQGVQILSNQKGGARMGYTIFGVEGVAPTLTSTTSRHYERYRVGDRYRRLTNVEYARIQGFPDDHCAGVSVYNQYPLFGNAIPPQLAGWAIDRLSSSWLLESRPSESQLRMVALEPA